MGVRLSTDALVLMPNFQNATGNGAAVSAFKAPTAMALLAVAASIAFAF